MKVKELIEALKKCGPEHRVIINAAFSGYEEVSTLMAKDHGGVGFRSSFEIIHTVEMIGNTTPGHLAAQGFNIIEEKFCAHDEEYDYSTLDLNKDNKDSNK